MGLWLTGWTGDNTGHRIAGRACNKLLLSFTEDISPQQFIAFAQSNVLTFKKASGETIPWHQNIFLTCLTPGARNGIACQVETATRGNSGVNENFLGLEVCEYEENGSAKAAWKPGVHLFLVGFAPYRAGSPATLATAIIDKHVKKVTQSTPVFTDIPLPLPFARKAGPKRKARR